MPSKTRKKYTAEFKFKLVEEIIKNENITATSRKYSVNYGLLVKWKKQFLERGKEIFETNNDKEKQELERQIIKLEQIIGKKEVELNLLKNFSDFYQSRKPT
jgi:transposase-like protein